jgi:hypothetical protein
MLRETVKIVVTADLSKITEYFKNGHKTDMIHISLLLPTDLVTFRLQFIGKISAFCRNIVQIESKTLKAN